MSVDSNVTVNDIKVESKKYKSIGDYIRQNTNGFRGDFSVVVTNLSKQDEVVGVIYPWGRDEEAAEFRIHPDGTEEIY